jgi:RHS repeat-associated protein
VTDTVGSKVTDRFFSSDWQLLETKVGSNTVSRNVWSPVYVDGLVLRDRDTDGNGSLDERLYALQDANWNTTALVNNSGTVQERYTYTPFGQVTFRDGSGSMLSGSAKDWVFLHQGGERIAAGDYEFRNRVYSPSLGRWLSNDPLGFHGRDQNWYRAVGNNPGNGNDPWGLIWPILVLGGAAIGWLVTSPPPVQAPTKDGEAVFPPLDIGEKIGGVTIGLGVGSVANLALLVSKAVIRQLIITGNSFPKTRKELHKDLTAKGFEAKPPSQFKGNVRYIHPDGRKVTVKDTGEVIPTSPARSMDGKIYPQRTDYNFNRLPDQSHSTGHFVEPFKK